MVGHISQRVREGGRGGGEGKNRYQLEVLTHSALGFSSKLNSSLRNKGLVQKRPTLLKG